MKILKNVLSLVKPKKVEKTDNIVKVRTNINDITVTDDVLGAKTKAFMYDETTYEKEEYANMELEKRVTQIEEEVQTIQLAIAELINAKSEGVQPSLAIATIYSEYSAISQMYANMIEKGIFSIDRVPARYKAETEAVLELHKQEKEDEE